MTHGRAERLAQQAAQFEERLRDPDYVKLMLNQRGARQLARGFSGMSLPEVTHTSTTEQTKHEAADKPSRGFLLEGLGSITHFIASPVLLLLRGRIVRAQS